MWTVLYIIAGLSLLLTFHRRNAVWGGATFGFLIGLGIAFFKAGFDWGIVWKAVTVGALIGAVVEFVGSAGKD